MLTFFTISLNPSLSCPQGTVISQHDCSMNISRFPSDKHR